MYGRKGNFTVYPDGVKTCISDEQADEIEKYSVAKAKYIKEAKEIKEKYN